MQKTVFIASSEEAWHIAARLGEMLEAVGVKPLLWKSAFQPGTLTFEGIEDVARKVSGAIVIASPDDATDIRGRKVRTPRANVMIEFGYLTCALGRRRVALCRFDGANLATDLRGLTFVSLGRWDDDVDGEAWVLPKEAATVLRQWTRSLPSVLPNVPGYRMGHGYSGRWKLAMRMDKWRDRNIEGAERCDVDGFLDLFMMTDRDNGFGFLSATHDISLATVAGRIRVADRVMNVCVDASGNLTFETTIHSRMVLESKGAGSDYESLFKNVYERHWAARWSFTPKRKKTSEWMLSGKYTSGSGGRTRSHGLAELMRWSSGA